MRRRESPVPRGHVVCLTEHGERLAVIVSAGFAQALEGC